MRYPFLVSNKPAAFTADEARTVIEVVTAQVKDIFKDLVTEPAVERREHNPKFPYTTGTITLVFPFTREISGRALDKARVTASELIARIGKNTPSHFDHNPDNCELPDKYFHLKLSVTGSHIEYRHRDASGFFWPGYNPYFHGSEIEDILPEKQLHRILHYLLSVR